MLNARNTKTFVTVFAISIGLVHCSSSGSSSSGVDGGGGAGGAGVGPDGGVCAPSATDDACNTCLKTHCCNELGACTADPDCVALSICVVNCGSDQTCGNNCVTQHTEGFNTIGPLIQCTNASCGTACM
jgi:hypothetical protein